MKRTVLLATVALLVTACGTTSDPQAETRVDAEPALQPLPSLAEVHAQRLAILESWIEHPDGVIDYARLAEIARLRHGPDWLPWGTFPSMETFLLPDEIEDLVSNHFVGITEIVVED